MWIYEENEIKSIIDLDKTNQEKFGFIYLIHNFTLDKMYIGKKQLQSTRWKPIAKSTYEKLKKEGFKDLKRHKNKNKSKKGSPFWMYKKKIVTESNWLLYTGSNKELNEDIKKGHDVGKFILKFANTSKQLTYLETELLFEQDVLRNEMYYNDNILGKFYKKDLDE